ncbi:MAG: bifunctional phosphopantothenoylcysteine decarboxylase/phosphopantothenate--cysteine ligase CoaBC [Gammaproteobacteria bacterium]|nr:bifunctional phosphopantothenoylcysteine decarboxylase/phosphopantothenate--cysteine ligase CoaBC [Gammaproteobacteria bacterium]
MDNQRVLLGVTGGIAAYKSPDLVRRLKDAGAEVRVVMTPSATRLVSPTVFQAVSGYPVRSELWDEAAEAAMGHIELARWATLVLIAPATAHLMSQLATGSAGNLLTTLCLATSAPVVLAPAMNQAMWRHAATQANRATLQSRGVRFIGPASGSQACGDVGPGRMVEPTDIVAALGEASGGDIGGLLKGIRVLITAGPTREPIDPVRFISNRSSGKMGFAMASAAVAAGADVTLVAGPVQLPTPAGVRRIDVETAAEMFAATLGQIADVDIYIGAAAISDYRPEPASQKIKKRTDRLTLEMLKSPDLLATVAARSAGPFTVGFAAETERLEEYARQKLTAKRLDMIVANQVGAKLGFDEDENSVLILWRDGQEAIGRMDKYDLARRIVAVVASRFTAARDSRVTPIRRPG